MASPSTFMMKKLGIVALENMPRLLELSMRQLVIPEIWKFTRITPILKPNKPATKRDAYRNIPLLHVEKVLEATFANTETTFLIWFQENNITHNKV